MSDNKHGNPRKYMIRNYKKAFKVSTHSGTYQYFSSFHVKNIKSRSRNKNNFKNQKNFKKNDKVLGDIMK